MKNQMRSAKCDAGKGGDEKKSQTRTGESRTHDVSENILRSHMENHLHVWWILNIDFFTIHIESEYIKQTKFRKSWRQLE